MRPEESNGRTTGATKVKLLGSTRKVETCNSTKICGIVPKYMGQNLIFYYLIKFHKGSMRGIAVISY
jgi:hypothetical protein